MPNSQKLYHMMFAAAADAVELLEQQKHFEARLSLIRAQLRAEALVLSEADAERGGETDVLRYGSRTDRKRLEIDEKA